MSTSTADLTAFVTLPKIVFAAASIIIIFLATHIIDHLKYKLTLSKYPIANPKWGPAEKATFTTSAGAILQKGVDIAKGGPFRLNDKSAARLVLPPKYIDEVKNDKRLDFHSFVGKQFFSTYPGFDAFSTSVNQTIFQDAVRTQLTQALGMTVQPIADEAPKTLDLVYGQAPDWKEAVLTPCLLKSVSRISSLIFLGESFMNNADWQRISVMYTVDAFMAATALNNWPAPLRPIVHWFLPECKKIRAEVKLAKGLIQPEVDRRREELVANGGKPRGKVLDSVDWFSASAKGQDFDYANAELSLSMAAIHTTTNTLGFAIYDLIENPKYFDLLREELKTVFEQEGRKWEKSTLFKLRLMDSALKESMRLHPHSLINMPRQATESISLSDGTTIPKSAFVMMGPVLMKDANIFPEPDRFNGHRFLDLRNIPGNENKHQFVTTSPECNVFGHGSHACPGRFFASNELKLLLAHMIMYYDWKLPEGQKNVQHSYNGLRASPNSRQKVLYKSREPEIPASEATNGM